MDTKQTLAQMLADKAKLDAKIKEMTAKEYDNLKKEHDTISARLAEIESAFKMMGMGTKAGRPPMTPEQKAEAKAKREASKPQTPEQIAAQTEKSNVLAVLKPVETPAPIVESIAA